MNAVVDLIKPTEKRNSTFTRGLSKAIEQPMLYFNLTIAGVAVETRVDSAAQSTITSCSLLVKIRQKLRSQRESVPVLERPSVCSLERIVWEKENSWQLAQFEVRVEADGESA